jgi:dTDP-4-dehydrorhamnose 3,5-epimerase
MPFRFESVEIPGPVLIHVDSFDDGRGFFIESYKQSEFERNGIPDTFVQDNWSRSVGGSLRGLHYQRAPKAQAKLISVVRGEIFDVVVDIRRGSPSFGRWLGVKLSEMSRKMLYVPVGFAHGFCVLSELADVVYKVSAEYDPEFESGIVWNDPGLAITWPVQKPVLSARDSRLPCFRDAETFFR